MKAAVLPIGNIDSSSDKPILIPDGEYTAAYLKHETWIYKGKQPKLTITFAIQDFGEFYLKSICAHYNLSRLKGKPRRNGHFTTGWSSDFMFDYSNVFEAPTRKDRISMCRFRNVFVKVTTRTVTKNRDQREYPESLRYSVVDRMKQRIEI